MKVLFLDFDGVINTYWWNADGTKVDIGYKDKCTNFQAVQWISHFCTKYDYKIVVTSTWRIHSTVEQLRQVLYNSGLSKKVEVLDKTEYLHHDHITRGEEIYLWLKSHPGVENYIIVDDDDDFGYTPYMRDHFIKTNFYDGFKTTDFFAMEHMHKQLFKEMALNGAGVYIRNDSSCGQ